MRITWKFHQPIENSSISNHHFLLIDLELINQLLLNSSTDLMLIDYQILSIRASEDSDEYIKSHILPFQQINRNWSNDRMTTIYLDDWLQYDERINNIFIDLYRVVYIYWLIGNDGQRWLFGILKEFVYIGRSDQQPTEWITMHNQQAKLAFIRSVPKSMVNLSWIDRLMN